MTKLKLGAIMDDKPVKLTIEIPAAVHRDLVACAEVLTRDTGQSVPDPTKLIVSMLERFMATDLRKLEGASIPHRFFNSSPSANLLR